LKNEYLKLAHNQNYFTLSFSAPHFPVSDVNYSYMLENLNSDWFLSSSNQATFTNIPPGKYVIKVRASLNTFQWSEPTLLPIFIAQPLWKRWYAYFIYVSVFVLLLFLFQKYTRERELLKSDLKLESLTREKEKELNNVKHRFFTNISHEIRTPVTLIIGAANRLIDNGMVNKTSQKELDVMRNSSRHLLNLINELLDFRRLEMDGIKLKVAKGNIVKFVHEIYLSFQTQASSTNIDYIFLSCNHEIELWYDRAQMEKVVYNLISNAFKFTPSGGSITVELDCDDQHGYLKVIDSGEGVDNDKLTEIFKRFYQSENASEIRKTGFGLGLSISKEIVQLHGGEIDALNNVDKGICISVKLPLDNTHFPFEQQLKNFKTSENLENYISSHETLNTEVSLSEYSNSSLLIVEDNAQIREYIKNLFTDINTVLTASNGEEGYNLTLENLPDLIISDVMMPVMDGVSMTKKIKTNMQTSHIPIILLTARTNLIYKKEGFEVGADEYITKPFNETLLKTRVYNLLKSRKLLSEKLLNEYISKPIEELSISTPDQQFLAGLTKVIESNIHENEINTKIISEALCMSHSVVYKKIKNLTGLSIIEFVRDFKLKRAAILLVKYQLSVSDVCYKVGFSDRRYFSKIFKQKFGVTPSEYAKNESNTEQGL
jgi:signal transduction histidine kinase/CheY-like chemotaxis protein